MHRRTEVTHAVFLVSIYISGHNFGFFRNTLQTQIFIHVRSLTHIDTCTHPTFMSTSERLSWLDLEIHEVDHQHHKFVFFLICYYHEPNANDVIGNVILGSVFFSRY
jgi:hypothetical protein